MIFSAYSLVLFLLFQIFLSILYFFNEIYQPSQEFFSSLSYILNLKTCYLKISQLHLLRFCFECFLLFFFLMKSFLYVDFLLKIWIFTCKKWRIRFYLYNICCRCVKFSKITCSSLYVKCHLTVAIHDAFFIFN